jgi:hypothetical protein
MGLGLVHTLDVGIAAEALDAGVWKAQAVQRNQLATHYRYVISPQSRILLSKQ